MFANPPYGVEWRPQEDFVRDEYNTLGFAGRFGAGLPRINDGSLLFLQHMIAKRHRAPEEGGDGSDIAIVFNGSPLFTGDAGSGESNIRRWIIEHDWLDAVVALPDQLFYNTGIYTYIWLVTNRKPPHLGYDNESGLDALLALVRDHCAAYLAAEVLPHVPDAWIDYSKTKVGHEIPLNCHFYVYQPPEPLAVIEADIKRLEAEIIAMLGEVA